MSVWLTRYESSVANSLLATFAISGVQALLFGVYTLRNPDVYQWTDASNSKVAEDNATFKKFKCYFTTMLALALVKVLLSLIALTISNEAAATICAILLIVLVPVEFVVNCVGCCTRFSDAGKRLTIEEAPTSGKFMSVMVILTIIVGGLAILGAILFGIFLYLLSNAMTKH